MIFNQDRNALRKMYQDAWNKLQEGKVLTPLEAQISDVVKQHPEYHQAVSGPLDKDYFPEAGETNPFMHMSLHLAIRDQVSTNRPAGIKELFVRLAEKLESQHAAEHLFAEHMGEELWQAQREARMPDEKRYFERLSAALATK